MVILTKLKSLRAMLQRLVASFALVALASICLALPARAADANVFVAASLIDVLEKLAVKFEQSSGREVAIIPGASSTLSKQVLAGAPADIFISADRFNADLVAKPRAVHPVELFGNRLVIVAFGATTGEVELADLPGVLGDSRLAVGDPTHVPAGIYAKEALENAGVWGALQNRLAPAGDVRAATAFVARGAAKFGIVYATDAVFESLTIAGEIDESFHTPIRYWSVLVSLDNETADMFWSYILSFEGQSLLEGEGFLTTMSPDD